MKIEKKKLNQKMKDLRVTYLKKFSISTHLFSFHFSYASFSNIFVFVFPIEIKMRGVYVVGNERKRECKKCFLLFFSTSLNIFFKRDKKCGVYVRVVMGKN